MRGTPRASCCDRIFDAAAKHGVVILLDLHVISDKAGIQDLWYDKTANNDRILDIWTQVLKHVAGRWNLMGIDIKNEPHGIATWGKGNPKTDWNVFAQHAIATLANRVPEFQGVFFVEGVEKSPDQKYVAGGGETLMVCAGHPFVQAEKIWTNGLCTGEKNRQCHNYIYV